MKNAGNLPPGVQSKNLLITFENFYKRKLENRGLGLRTSDFFSNTTTFRKQLMKTLWHIVLPDFRKVLFFSFLSEAALTYFAYSLILYSRAYKKALNEPWEHATELLLLTTLTILSIFVGRLLAQQRFKIQKRMGAKIGQTLRSILFKKISLSSKATLDSIDQGFIAKHLFYDFASIGRYFVQYSSIYVLPLVLLFHIFFVFQFVGFLSLALLPVFALSVLFLAVFEYKKMIKIKQLKKLGWNKMGLIATLIPKMKKIKIESLELFFLDKLKQMRSAEMVFLYELNLFQSLTNFVLYLTPTLSSFVIILILAYTQPDFKTSVAFTIVTLMNRLRGPLLSFGRFVEAKVDMRIGIKSLNFFYNGIDDLSMNRPRGLRGGQGSPAERPEKISIRNLKEIRILDDEKRKEIKVLLAAIFERGKEYQLGLEKPVSEEEDNSMLKNTILQILNDKNPEDSEIRDRIIPEQAEKLMETREIKMLKLPQLELSQGDKVALSGIEGSGFRTFISLVTGEVIGEQLGLEVYGRVSYLSLGGNFFFEGETIRKNIILNQNYDEKKYKTILKLLEFELEKFPGGDFLQLSEGGRNISQSGLRKILIARFLYPEREIYVFDSFVVDTSRQENLLLKKLIFGPMLGPKTVIFASNDKEFLKEANRVLVFERGEIVKDGKYEEIIKNDKKSIFEVLENDEKEEKRNEMDDGNENQNIFKRKKSYKENNKKKNYQNSNRNFSENSLENLIASKRESKKSFKTSFENFEEKIIKENRKKNQIELNSLNSLDSVLEKKNPKNKINPKRSKIFPIEKILPETKVKLSPLSPEPSSQKPTSNPFVTQYPTLKLAKEYQKALRAFWSHQILKKAGTFFEKERINSFSPPKTLLRFISLVGQFRLICWVSLFIFSSLLFVSSDIWLAVWAGDIFTFSTTWVYLLIYAGLTLFSSLFVLIRDTYYMANFRLIADQLSRLLLNHLMNITITWLSRNPSSRIFSRMTREQMAVDEELNSLSLNFFANLIQMLVGFVVVNFIYTGIWLPFTFLILLYTWKLLSSFATFIEPLSIQHSLVKSSLYQIYMEAMRAFPNIRANHTESYLHKRFFYQNDLFQNLTTKIYNFSMRWLGIRLMVLSTLIQIVNFGLPLILLFFFPNFIEEQIWALLLAVAWVIRTNSALTTMVINLAGCYARIVSLERINQFVCNQEEENRVTDLDFKPDFKKPAFSITNFYLSLNNKPQALQIENLEISCKRTAILGKNSSGKHLLIESLLGLFLPEKREGCSIKIFGIDRLKVNTRKMREKMVYLTAKPLIFRGTLGDNLDPYNQFTLEEKKRVLGYLKITDLFQLLEEKANLKNVKNFYRANGKSIYQKIRKKMNGVIPHNIRFGNKIPGIGKSFGKKNFLFYRKKR